MIHLFLLLISWFMLSITPTREVPASAIQGSWHGNGTTLIFSGNYFSVAGYGEKEFLFTQGGSWKMNNNSIDLTYEYNTKDSTTVGSTQTCKLQLLKDGLELNGISYNRIDDNTPGQLHGTWLFSTRVVDGKPGAPRSADEPRKTMKILSGTRFQWIAYNVVTKEFFGTGGGTYTTINGKYTETIDFFSRDPSRIGASLEFDFRIDGDNWHHQGLNSRGEPLYEIWSARK